jgi:hypothetical protein
MSLHSLPPELLTAVIAELWGSDLRSCLGVSREFHTRAVARLFRTVHLRLGTEGAPEVLNNSSLYNADAHSMWSEAEAMDTQQAWDLLELIEVGGAFAHGVRKLVVHAENGRHAAIFERSECTLKDPLIYNMLIYYF